MKKPFLLLFLIFSSFGLLYAEDPLPRLEGVMMDAARPQESLAVIDGEPVKKGDHHRGYKILEVLPNQVKIQNEKTQKQETLTVGAAPVVSQEADSSVSRAISEEKPVAGPQPKEVSGNMLQRFEQQFKNVQQNLNPAKWVNKAYEMKAVLDLARIYNAAVNYYNQKKTLAKDVKELVKANYLPASFEEPTRSGYVFYLNPVIQPFGVHADPVKKDTGLHYFFVGQDAVIRVAEGKPANEKSPPHDY